MTTKNSITKDLDELLEYLGVDRPTLRKAVKEGIRRLIKPEIDPRINAYLRNDPPINSKLEA